MPSGEDVVQGRDLTVRGLITAMVEKHGPGLEEELLNRGDIKEGLCMLVNGRNVLSMPKKYETPLQDGDEVLITIQIAGG